MSLRKSDGNMYPWVTHMHTHLRGTCPHQCPYCYVQAIAKDLAEKRNLPKMLEMYSGPVRLEEHEFETNYGHGKVIFIEHMNDLFATGVCDEWICRIIRHAKSWWQNTYVYQTKNPGRAIKWIGLKIDGAIIRPRKDVFGTTIETNRITGRCAPSTQDRINAMCQIRRLYPDMTLFITIEPVMDFDVGILLSWMRDAKPTFINIGADSKHSGLLEPSAEKLRSFIAGIQELGIEIREKTNLERLLK